MLDCFRIGEKFVYLIYFGVFFLPVLSAGYQGLLLYRELFNKMGGKLLILSYKILLYNKKGVYDMYE